MRFRHEYSIDLVFGIWTYHLRDSQTCLVHWYEFHVPYDRIYVREHVFERHNCLLLLKAVAVMTQVLGTLEQCHILPQVKCVLAGKIQRRSLPIWLQPSVGMLTYTILARGVTLSGTTLASCIGDSVTRFLGVRVSSVTLPIYLLTRVY